MAQLKIDILVDDHDAQARISGVERAVEAVKSAATNAGDTLSRFSSGAQSAFSSGLSSISSFGSSVASTFSSIASGVSSATMEIVAGVGTLQGGLATLGIGKVVDEFLDWTGAMADMRDKTGLTLNELQRFQYAGDLVGVSIESITSAATMMQKRLGADNSGAVGALKELGINLDMFKSQDIGEQMTIVLDALGRVEDPMRRMALGADIMGRSFATMVPLAKSNIRELGDEAERFGAVAPDSIIEGGDRAGDALSKAMKVLRNIAAVGVSAAIAEFDKFHLDESWVGFTNALNFIHPGVVSAPKAPGSPLEGLRQSSPHGSGDEAKLFAPNMEEENRLLKENIAEVKKKQEAERQLAADMLPLTEAQKRRVDAMELEHRSSSVEAATLGVSSAAIATYIANLKEAMDAKTKQAKVWVEAQDAMGKAMTVHPLTSLPGSTLDESAIGGALANSRDASAKYWADLTAMSLSGTNRQIFDIERERAAKLRAISEEKNIDALTRADEMTSANAYYNHLGALAIGTQNTIVERMRAAGVATKADLQATADAAKRDYEQMKQSGQFSAAEVQAAWQRSADATAAALDTVAGRIKNALSSAFTEGFGGLANSLSSVLTGGMSLAEAFKDYATNVAKNFTQSALSMIPLIGPMLSQFAGPIIDGIKKLFGGLFNHSGRNAVEDFAAGQGGFDALHANLLKLGDEGEQMWIKLTQQTKKGDKAGAEATIKEAQDLLAKGHASNPMEDAASAAGFSTTADLQAKAQQAVDLWKYMSDSGKYSAAAVQKAWEDANAALVASGDKQALAAQSAKAAIDDLTGKINGLQQSIANEAPEAVMGVVEEQTRAQIKVLEDQRAQQQKDFDGLQANFQDLTEHGITVPVHYKPDPFPGAPPSSGDTTRTDQGQFRGDGEGGDPVPDNYHSGGLLWRRMHRGGLASDEVPIIGQKGEFMVSRRGVAAIGVSALSRINQGQVPGGSSAGSTPMMTIIFDRDGDREARFLLPYITGEARRLGLS